MKEPKENYRTRIERAEKELTYVKRRILRISTLRVVLFVAGVAGVVAFGREATGLAVAIALLTFCPLLALVKYHNRLFLRKEWLETCLRVNQDELDGLEYRYDAFDGGNEFVDPVHRYSFDLDLFGPRSLFQAMNRTCTVFGKERLADWMRQHEEEKNRIEHRQKAVGELAGYDDLREEFRIAGLLYKGKSGDRKELEEWAASEACFSKRRWIRMLLWIVPGVDLILLLGGIGGWLSLNWFGLVFCAFVVASFMLIKPVGHVQMACDKKLRILSVYARLIRLIEKQTLHAPLLKELKTNFRTEGQAVTEALDRLALELERLDLRNNQLLYFLLEGSLFWQLRQVIRIEQWKLRHGAHLLRWLDTLGTFDALLSMATFAANHPRYVYPVIADQPFLFRAEGMGHPLMAEERCVTNEADIPSRPFFVVVTGANMAGKSTYLRTIGVNYVLACMGCPVCCSRLELYPARLVTSLRTTDSLTDHESYFFAELKRLKAIIDRLHRGEQLFVILDEILKGTNSADKQKGSVALMKQLVGLRANGIIATHDLLLGELVRQFPTQIRNCCFEADICDDELVFTYKLREGVARNLNACFLMKKMGIAVAD